MKSLIPAMLAVSFAFTNMAAPNWNEILGPSRAEIPLPLDKVVWRHDVNAALAEAKRNQKPLFVTMRCLPCKQCSAFDKEVLEGGAELNPLLARFVTVRLTNAANIDVRMFPVEGFQDLDLSWWGWFLSPEGNVYGVYGGRDHISDATRISSSGLMTALWRVLNHHYDPRRVSWNIDGPAPDLPGEPKTPRELPGYAAWYEKLHPNEKKAGSCIHCHQVNDILRTPAIAAKKFDKRRDVEVWPLPENVGLTLDRDDGLLVTAVTTDSPAARAGMKAGDRLGAADGRHLFTQTDFRGVLHRGPHDAGPVDAVWLRDSKVMAGKLNLLPGWRKTDLGWRMSISQGVIGTGPGFFPLSVSAAKRQQAGLSTNSMAIEPYMGRATNSAPYRAGLRGSDIVTAVNGINTNLVGRTFLVWFRQQYDAGDRVTLSVRSQGKTREVTYQLGETDH
jgi:serine protease Do